MVRRISRYLLISFFLILVLFPLPLLPASAQASARRLVSTGDLLEFVWSPRGDALFVTREGNRVTLDATRQQITGDLYRVDAADGSAQLLARNANTPAASHTGEGLSFVRLNEDGSARVISFDIETKQERVVGEIAWVSVPQWSGQGNELYYVRGGQVRAAARTERTLGFGAEALPRDARISPLGDRVAYIDVQGLWVTQGTRRRSIIPVENVTVPLPNFVWSNAGDKLAYIVTHNGFDPELWVADTTSDVKQRIAQGTGLEHFANLDWSPDDAYVLITRTPTGSSTASSAEIWRARADGSEVRQLTHNRSAEILPQYSPDGQAIAFIENGDLWLIELDADGMPRAEPNIPKRTETNFRTPRAPNAQRTPPATIRVRHDAANGCRGVPVGQIDWLDFETYVKRVVPSEVFASWDNDALKTQAVAARTYAWFWVLQHPTWDYDVTDSTAYQYMCDTRYATTDDAVEHTRGEYLDYAGYLVFAAYGAENGDPTLTNTFNNPYLLGVDDPVGFMRTRAGNGIGMSQWGAQRWATQFDWNYQQILRHYYSNITLQAPAGASADATPPIGAIVSPRNHWGVTANRAHLIVNASDEAAGIQSIDLRAHYRAGDGERDEIVATLYGEAREFTWDMTSLPNQTGIVVTPYLYDWKGNSRSGASITFDLDRRLPDGNMTAPTATTNPNITLQLNASDQGGSQLTDMMFSNDWEWQGENQYIEANSGSVVADADALNGSALRGLAGTNAAGAWYGPYTDKLRANTPYRAYFRIKTDNVTTTSEIAMLDVVVDGGTNILGLKRIRGVDLKAANTYQEFYVDFYYPGAATNGLEFRTAFRSNATLWLDRILVVQYPVPFASTAPWTLPGGEGNKRVIGKFVDGAGNVSSDAVSTVFFGQDPPPVLVPRHWLPLLFREH